MNWRRGARWRTCWPSPATAPDLLRVVGQALGHSAPAPTPVPAPDCASASDSAIVRAANFDADHRRLLTNKLAEKIEELQREIEERKQAESRIRHLNRVHAVVSGINSLVVRVSSREELCKGACRLAVVQGHFPHGLDRHGGPGLRGGDAFAWSGEAAELQKSIRISATGSPEADGLIGTAVLSRTAAVQRPAQPRGRSGLPRGAGGPRLSFHPRAAAGGQ